VLLYHWTDHAEEIRRDGFRVSQYDPVGDGLLGVMVSEHPTFWKTQGDKRLTLNVPDDVLRSEWRVAENVMPDVEDWRLPRDVADAYVVWE
jgi:hypothetical protein